jgi:hypothetical protein
MQILYSYLGNGLGFFVLSLALTSIMSHYYLSSNNWANGLTEEVDFINEHGKRYESALLLW